MFLVLHCQMANEMTTTRETWYYKRKHIVRSIPIIANCAIRHESTRDEKGCSLPSRDKNAFQGKSRSGNRVGERREPATLRPRI